MASVNKATLLGNLGRDPELRTFASGDRVASFRVATTEKWKDRQTGEARERTEWHTVQVFGGLVSVVERFLRKGSKVYLEGKLETRKWQDQSGQDRYSTEIVLRPYGGELVILDRRADGEEGPRPGSSGGYGGGAPGPSAPGPGPGNDVDDEIPF